MEDPNDKRKRIVFSILMVGALVSVIALYVIARPFLEDLRDLNIAFIATIILITTALIMAIKTGIPPKPPRTLLKKVPGVPPGPSEKPVNPAKHGMPSSAPKASVKSGIPPSPRKTNG